MSTQSKTEHSLNELIEIARDGEDFYNEAATKVNDVELETLFKRIANNKADIASSLSRAVAAAGGKPATDGTFVGSVQKMYGNFRAALGDTQYGYVAQLEETEDRLLEAFKEVLADEDTTPLVRTEVTRLLPEVQDTHKVMRKRKHAMKSA